MNPEHLHALLMLLADLRLQVHAQAQEIARLQQLSAGLEAALSEQGGLLPRCPIHDKPMFHAGGPGGPLVCPACANSVPA